MPLKFTFRDKGLYVFEDVSTWVSMLKSKGTVMPAVGDARACSAAEGTCCGVENLENTGCDKGLRRRVGVDAGREELRRCLEDLRERRHVFGDEDRSSACSTLVLYCIVSELAEKGVSLKVVDDPSIDTSSRTGKLIMGILALIAEFENDIRRERQMDGIKKARERGTRFGRKPLLIAETIQQVRKLRKSGKTAPEIMRQTSCRRRRFTVPYRHKPMSASPPRADKLSRDGRPLSARGATCVSRCEVAVGLLAKLLFGAKSA